MTFFIQVLRVRPLSTAAQFLSSAGELVVRGSEIFTVEHNRFLGSSSKVVQIEVEAPQGALVLRPRKIFLRSLEEKTKRKRSVARRRAKKRAAPTAAPAAGLLEALLGAVGRQKPSPALEQRKQPGTSVQCR